MNILTTKTLLDKILCINNGYVKNPLSHKNADGRLQNVAKNNDKKIDSINKSLNNERKKLSNLRLLKPGFPWI